LDNRARYEIFNPSLKLQQYITRYLHGYTVHNGQHTVRIPPSGGIFLSLVYGDLLEVHFSDRVYKKKHRVFIGGQLYTDFPVLKCNGKFGLIGLEFRPTGFYKMFGLNASKFTDNIYDLKDVLPADYQVIASIIRENNIEDILSKAEKYLTSRKKADANTDTVDQAIGHIEAANGNVSIAHLSQKIQISSRTLNRLFLKKVGLPPKSFAKIVQFNTILSYIEDNDNERLHSLAVDNGYFDHAHFIRDFKRFVGINPLEFFKSKNQFLKTFLGSKSSC